MANETPTNLPQTSQAIYTLGEEIETVISKWRSRVLHNLLVIGVIAIFPAVIQTILRAEKFPRERFTASALVIFYILLLGLAFAKRMAVKRRGWALIALIYGAGIISLARGGLVGDGRVYLSILPVMATLLLGIPAGLLTTVFSLATYLGFAILAYLGYLENWLIILKNPLTMDHWIYDGMVMMAMMVATALVLINFYQLQMRTLESERFNAQALRDAYRHMKEINLTLEEKIKQRTADLEHANQRLQFIATHDSLTELANRVLFYDRLEHALAQATRNQTSLSILFIDLDDFKQINDSYGHIAGDALLQKVAQRLCQCVRESDTLARIGGDEFTIILENLASAQDARTIAEKVWQAFHQPFLVAGKEISLTASVGLSQFPLDGKDAEELLIKADSAMYKIKSSHKDAYQFYTAS